MFRMGVATLALAAAVLSGAASADRVLTLEQSVQTGLQNSQALLSVRDDVRMAQQRIVEARSLYYPTLAVNMNASSYRAKDYVALPGEFGSTVLSPSADPDEFYAGRAQLRQLLYSGGRNRANLQMAQAALAQARIREESIRGQVTVDAVRTFYDVLLAEKRRSLADRTRQEVTAFSAGVRGSDAVAFRALMSRLRRRLADAQRDVESARLAYLSALGLELYTTVELSGDLTTTPVQEPLAKLLARAQEARLEIRGTEYQREMDRLAVNLTESERNPVVVFGAAYELNNSDFPLDRAFWNATLNVNLPIFDGFASRSRIRQSRLLASQNRIARAEVEDRINREVRESYNDVVFWQSEINERKSDLDGLQEAAKNETGRAALDRALARADWLEASEAYWESIHGHRVARAKLEKAVGLPLVP